MALSTADVRSELVQITDAAASDIRSMLASLVNASAEEVRDLILSDLPGLADDYQLASASLAADWYDDLRYEASVPGRFSAIIPAPATEARLESLARWAVSPLFSTSPDMGAATALLQGGLRGLIAEAHRSTIVGSSIADPKVTGWARYGRGATCAFCRLLISRGDVYKESTAKFHSHTNCSCVAAPVFEDTDSVDGFLTDPPPLSEAAGGDTARVRRWASKNL